MEMQGINTLDLCEQYGTPLYVYDSDRIIANYRRFENAFDVPKLKIHYACKALTNIAILRLFKELGAGLDCVSTQEVELALHVGFDPQDIIYTPNSVSTREYEKAMEYGVKITIDNLDILETFGIHHPNQPIFIRINPHLMAGGSAKISVGHIDSKFGISIHQVPIIKRIVKKLNIPVEGIHVHTGSDILDPDVFSKAAELIFSVADEFETVKSLDFGSGFKIKYSPSDLDTNLEELGKIFSDKFNAYCKESGRDLTLRFEPGKMMVSDAGYFFARTNVIKQTTACNFIGLDTGFNHLIRPMFYDAYHEIENVSNPDGRKKVYSVVGYICESDTFGEDRIISEVHKEDILVFKNAGAYCFAMSSNYNSRFRPAEVLIHQGKAHLIRERENFEDLIRKQHIPAIDGWLDEAKSLAIS